ncbi:hypothetical protein FQV30_09750 [Planomicrobium sp. CPCC 101110]|nr:hypothetical protein FQV30_09750 [Planomicrobium sp. CPCC 101110]
MAYEDRKGIACDGIGCRVKRRSVAHIGTPTAFAIAEMPLNWALDRILVFNKPEAERQSILKTRDFG